MRKSFSARLSALPKPNPDTVTRGGNVTRRPKTSEPALIAIYLPAGTRISRFQNSLSGGFLSRSGRGLTDALPRGSYEARVWLRQFIREGGDGHVWGTDKNIQPHRHRSRAWHDARRVRYELASCQSCRSRWRLLRGSRGAGGRTRGDDRPQGQQEGVRDTFWLGGQIRGLVGRRCRVELLRRRQAHHAVEPLPDFRLGDDRTRLV